MGLIGRFIDDACRAHPDLMAQVAEREFGDLTHWVERRQDGSLCGCLIGTIALAVDERSVAVMPPDDWRIGDDVVALAEHGLAGFDHERLTDVGAEVARLRAVVHCRLADARGYRKGQRVYGAMDGWTWESLHRASNALVERWIRARIRRRLAGHMVERVIAESMVEALCEAPLAHATAGDGDGRALGA